MQTFSGGACDQCARQSRQRTLEQGSFEERKLYGGGRGVAPSGGGEKGADRRPSRLRLPGAIDIAAHDLEGPFPPLGSGGGEVSKPPLPSVPGGGPWAPI
jgi:hypothetical protein